MIINISNSPKILAIGLSASLLAFAVAGCNSNNASETTPVTTNSAPVGVSGSTSSTQPTTSASAASFSAASVTWTKIEAAKADLDKIIASQELKKVHEAAFKVRDIVRTLPAQSSGLAPEKAKTLATQVQNVDQLASKLDEAGDSNNLKATQENQAGLSDTLDTIHDLYPAGTFK